MGKIGQMFMLRMLLFTLLLLLLWLLHIFNVFHGDTNYLVRMRPLLRVGVWIGTSLFPLFGNGSGLCGAVSWMD